ncbi:carbon-nitrogen hydrolase family protein [Bacillus sp. JJ1773]|uniref:carbon-nitrogen hydrolase family protein n=1 Tax=Bacillus sp. JJ1773 TaxID=3122965 RepID=UPI002FFDD488
MLTNYKVGVVQMSCVLGDKAANMEKVMLYIKQAIDQGAKLIVLPELFSTGYCVEDLDIKLAETLNGETISKLLNVSQENDIYIAGAIIEKGNEHGMLFDTAFLVGPEGLVGHHRKIHLWNGEKDRFLKGDDYSVFQTKLGSIGLQVCYEIGFPEGARIQALKGADLVLYPSAFGLPRLYAWEIASRARALENGIFIIAANRAGRDKNVVFAAHSKIISPNGSVVVTAGEEEGIIVGEVNLDYVAQQRKEIPYLDDIEQIKILNHLTDCLSYRI